MVERWQKSWSSVLLLSLLCSCSSILRRESSVETNLIQSSNPDPSLARVLRLKSDEDARRSIEKFVADRHIEAGSIVSAVGSLKRSNLRYANQSSGVKQEGPFEVVSLSGLVFARELDAQSGFNELVVGSIRR